ncbi:negative regulator of systemic acquired resistance SNI1 [Prunus yedoensis var. nudiflora]|uniref:Negative regulator of systemic acquired resistance SNI1 n=1 Tax=Prunus yedoensis var. nudiflora TaxID=2094558 RepID=A0A314XP73_PRUYE|nr:negative regulator of systemic acquired resistance SNI1 [Prunus yedoensis var. nudiflora]
MIAVRGDLLITPRDQLTRGFQLLIQDLADPTREGNFRASETKIMGLDVSKTSAYMQGSTTRADGVRTPVVEIILDELTYNRDILSPFLQLPATSHGTSFISLSKFDSVIGFICT